MPEVNDDVAAELIELFATRKWTLAVAESCTGGMLGARITGVPGASSCFLGGVIAYDNALKRDLLEVPSELLERHGAVSSETAAAMASGIRHRTGADVGLALTGLAGPGGATPGKPRGRVYIAVDGPGDTNGRVLVYTFAGDRAAVRRQACEQALKLLLTASRQGVA